MTVNEREDKGNDMQQRSPDRLKYAIIQSVIRVLIRKPQGHTKLFFFFLNQVALILPKDIKRLCVN